MSRDITQLHPRLQTAIEQLKKICSEHGLKVGIGECFRTVAEQDELYAQGRTKPGKKVTNAKGSSYSSQHQWGIAVDFFKNIKGHEYDDTAFFYKVASVAKGLGLGWGGDWTSFKDMPHLYLPDWGSTTTKLKSLYGTPDKFRKTWKPETVAPVQNKGGYKYSVGQFVTVSTHYKGKNDTNEKVFGLNPHLNMKIVAIHKGARNPYQTDFGTFINDGDVRGIANKSSLAEVQAKETRKTELPTSNDTYSIGKTYTIKVDGLRIRTGPGTNYPAKAYNQLSSNAKKHAHVDGTLKEGTKVTCKDIFVDGKDIWVLIPSGWIAAVYKGMVYVA